MLVPQSALSGARTAEIIRRNMPSTFVGRIGAAVKMVLGKFRAYVSNFTDR
jgi:hypothetical protein